MPSLISDRVLVPIREGGGGALFLRPSAPDHGATLGHTLGSDERSDTDCWFGKADQQTVICKFLIQQTGKFWAGGLILLQG